jgi:hypothetical protein
MALPLTLYSLVTLQRNDMFTGLVEDVTTYAPEFSKVPVVTRSGTYYEIVRRTALPTAGFRAINNGASSSASTFKKELHEMFFMDAPINVDEAIVKGDDRSTGDVLSHEAMGTLQSAIITIGSQFYYGTSSNAFGFQGLRAQLSGVITAGATTNSTSAYLVWFNPWGVNFDVGRDGEIAMKPWNIQQISAPTSGASGNIFAWVSNLSSFIGLSVKSTYSVWAVVGIDATHKLTDAIGAQLISLIPLNRRQGLQWFMNRSAHYGLQSSRTSIGNQPASSRSGTPAWSPPPEECNGYPIVVTDSITNSESN